MKRMEFSLNGKTYQGSLQEDIEIIVDSGTSFFLMPYVDLKNFLAILKAKIELQCS